MNYNVSIMMMILFHVSLLLNISYLQDRARISYISVHTCIYSIRSLKSTKVDGMAEGAAM